MSKMKKCKDCGAEVSKSAKTCPKCGAKLKRSHPVLIAILVFIIVIIILGCISQISNKSSNISVPLVNSINQDTTEAYMTLEKFNKIQTGMTYDEVVAIVGKEGTLDTESSSGSITFKTYHWYASNGISNAAIIFQNGKVTAKSQFGLDN